MNKELEKNPDNLSCRVTLALSYQAIEENEKALAQYTAIFQKEPNLNVIRFDYANLLADMGQNDEAIKQYNLSISKYPDNGSKTCCHGRIATGFLISISIPLLIERTQSGISLSNAQSPPPITFPARAVAIAIVPSLCKKERRNDDDIISTHPFDDEYIS